jgi:tRNA U34 5-methylaminomethyl-2-thiouridine-forming methyltransferase MnmC
MQRILKITTDGSFTLFVPSLNEHFHSVHGAFTESNHIFIKPQDFNYIAPHFEAINILEFGLGTGLNALLTIQKSLETDKPIFYHALEKFPVLPHTSLVLIKHF